ncbi:23S rRNA (guanosine(2251)-2'-O)-methyltransferase RlmB [Dyadobacter sandarakinus]|uniref:23S rRNA (Guanosine(2251)-2'-O)-methyltransferase RlmB n=1 Tax=Dyadobacter sandarakinus TaxID=2747268 RepID=A0ABX7ID19_9BACT|nr:23S rRNA (guanosine(2251)-2'-O)-methyltransferase RlmB [Dyadobacter sandarakinus]QRR03810.1 23S rRNA (guanosine(2251)-2'-O)-methyltransferase RlmB [Dyadobacter sandarakinus]
MEKRKYPVRKPAPRPSQADMVFGTQSVLETLRSGKEIERLFVQREFGLNEIEKLAKEREVPLQRVPVEKLNRITRKNHQGVIAFVSPIRYMPLHNVLTQVFEEGKTPLFLLLDRITDVRNFGAIARTAECAGVQAIIVPMKGGAQINADAMKTSSGALNFLPICREPNLGETLTYLRNSGLQIIACTEKTEKSVYQVDYSIPTVIIMGSEEDGISREFLQMADASAKIPLNGQVESLNVSVACSVILYEAVRQRLV